MFEYAENTQRLNHIITNHEHVFARMRRRITQALLHQMNGCENTNTFRPNCNWRRSRIYHNLMRTPIRTRINYENGKVKINTFIKNRNFVVEIASFAAHNEIEISRFLRKHTFRSDTELAGGRANLTVFEWVHLKT